MREGWIERVKASVSLLDAAAVLGLNPARMGSWSPCPLCGADKRGAEDRRGPVGMGKERGKWHCWQCSKGGDVLDLVAAFRMGSTLDGFTADNWVALRAHCSALGWLAEDEPTRHVRSSGRKITPMGPRTQDTGDGSEESGASWSPTLATDAAARLWTPEALVVLEYLQQVRGLDEASINAFRLGAQRARDGSWWVTIPLTDARDNVVNVRFRSVPGPCSSRQVVGCDRCQECKKSKSYRVCKGRPLPLFGAQNLSNDLGSLVVVTEGELDVVALYQYGFTRGVVSGTAGATALKDEWLDLLEPYAGFILVHDQDSKGEEGATLLADKLGRYRCSRGVLPRKDAGECLADGVSGDDVERAINSSKAMLATEVVGLGGYADDIERLMANQSELLGRPTGSRRLDHVLGGVRPGLIIVTGETGEGKTTFCTWLLDEQAKAGVPSLLTSFEQSPVGTVQKILRAQLGGDFTTFSEAERRAAMAEIGKRPLSLVKHRGQMGYEELHDIIRFAVRRYGVRNVLVDHLGFIIDPDEEDERRAIQAAVRPLSLMAEHEGVSLFLVCHPSNQAVQQRRRVSLADLKGASAIRQDAHEVWVVETAKPTAKRPWPGAWIHLDKIRSDFGASGSSVLLAFDPLACVYRDSWEETPSGKRGVRVAVPEQKRRAVPRGGQRKPSDSDSAPTNEED